LIRHFKKNVKSHVFLKSEKKHKIRILEHWLRDEAVSAAQLPLAEPPYRPRTRHSP